MCLSNVAFSSLVYNQCGYIDIVQVLAESSMQAAVEEIKALPEYSSEGEVSALVNFMVIITLISVCDYGCQT